MFQNMITKEEISLKELDFKLRKQLIEKHNLYGNMGSGTIVIKMKNGGSIRLNYTKLQRASYGRCHRRYKH